MRHRDTDKHYALEIGKWMAPLAVMGGSLVHHGYATGYALLAIAATPFALVLAVTTELPWEDWSHY